MGEVYRARDVRIDRAVALKVIPEEFFESEERRQRFDREARMLASLSHPGIAALYSFEEIPSSSPSFSSRHIIVMELVAGVTLRERLKAGGISAREAVDIAAQIARGLAAAHEKGIVHRDLKPENVVVSKDGRVKVLDFGLAKLSPQAGAGDDLTSAGTRSRLTEAGAVFGTVGYMSPEQVRGEPADARSDIFSLGIVLYEMLSGTNPFRGPTSAETMTAILRQDVPPVVAEGAPPALAAIVSRCLEKMPGKRFQSAEDLAFVLKSSSGSSPAASDSAPVRMAGGRGRLTIAAACAAGLVLGVLGGHFLRRTPRTEDAKALRFFIPPPEGGSFFYQFESATVAVSPDGSQVAYVASDPKGGRRLWLRSLSAFDAVSLAGTEGAVSVFWSPDGKSIGFFVDTKLKRLDLPGGAPVTICEDTGGGGKAGTWGRGGEILFSSVQGDAIYRVSASGGAATVVLKPDAAAGETRVVWPWFLPDGERYLFFARTEDGGRVMLAEPGRPSRLVVKAASQVEYSDPGYVLYVNGGVLLGQRFDVRTGATSGHPFSVAERVAYFLSTGAASFATSRGGTLVFQPQSDVHRLVWFDRSGRELGTVGQPSGLLAVYVPPDGRPVLFDRARSDLGTYDVWSYDADRNVETRVTSAPDTEFGARWLPGGRSIVYSSVLGRNPHIVRLDLATGKQDEILPQGGFQTAADVSPDGRTLLYFERPDRGDFALWTLPLAGGGVPHRFLEAAFTSDDARFSPDGRFIAFVAADSGRPEVYVVPYPGPGEKVRVSSSGADLVRWSRDGRELLFLGADGRFMATPVRTSPSLQLGEPRPLFTLKASSKWLSFDVSADGTRFLAVVPEVVAARAPLSVVVNWPVGVEK
jgi:Tol biopolymer transport system component